MDSANPYDQATTPPRQPRAPRDEVRSPRGGRGRGYRGRGGPRPDGTSRGRGRGRGHNRRLSETQPVDPTKPAMDAVEVRRTSTQDGSAQAPQTNGGTHTETAIEEDPDAELCFICASPVVHYSIAPCNHRTCHICALRLRALYKTKACAHCRAQADYVIFTDDAGRRFEDFTQQDLVRSDASLGIKYEKNEVVEDTQLLLRYNCPEAHCDQALYGWPDLHKHVKSQHDRMMCDLCTRNKKVFTHEHELFTKADLRKHERFGDDNPGAIDQSGFKGHPECGFCRQRFYGDDELYTHCRDKHERCHICDRQSASRQQQYYQNYDELEKHFRTDHFLCADSDCMDQKFVVFESEMDLKAHQLEKHPNGLTKDARRDAMRVDMRGFENYRQSNEYERGGRRREGRGRGRGRDPNTDEPLPVSTAQNLSRAELAYQRQLAIHSAQSVSNRTFGGQLTSRDAQPARAAQNRPTTVTAPVSNDAPAQNANANPPSLDSLNLNQTQSANLSPAERARQVRHAAVIERASNLLGNDQVRLSSFRSNVSSYRNSSMTATQLVDAFFALFDTDSTSLGTLIRELADIFEIATKKDDLLRAWNNWRAINEDYPTLPGPNGQPAGGAGGSGSGGKRILKLKNSTAQSGRSSMGRAGSWGGANGADGSSEAYPGLPGASARSNAQKKVPWANGSSSSSAPTPARASPAPRPMVASRPAPSATNRNADAFPSLPAAAKPGMTSLRPGYAGNPTLRDNRSGSSTPRTAWAGGAVNGGSVSAAVEAAAATAEGNAASGKGKGKKNQKVSLMHWG